jgi:hypothetical protein
MAPPKETKEVEMKDAVADPAAAAAAEPKKELSPVEIQKILFAGWSWVVLVGKHSMGAHRRFVHRRSTQLEPDQAQRD